MPKVDLRDFDYRVVGETDARMWRAYYNHHFLTLFWQLLKLLRTQLRLSWLATLRLAYYSAWAAADYRINRGKVNQKRVLKNLTAFDRIISQHALEPFDYKRAAELELAWWDVHRKSRTNNAELEQSLAEAAAVIYHVEPRSLGRYAHYRAEAMILPRHQGDSPENSVDWAEIERMTIASWKALHQAIHNK